MKIRREAVPNRETATVRALGGEWAPVLEEQKEACIRFRGNEEGKGRGEVRGAGSSQPRKGESLPTEGTGKLWE